MKSNRLVVFAASRQWADSVNLLLMFSMRTLVLRWALRALESGPGECEGRTTERMLLGNVEVQHLCGQSRQFKT